MNPNFNRRQFIGLAVCVAVNTALPGCKKKEPEWTAAKDDKLKPLAFEISEGKATPLSGSGWKRCDDYIHLQLSGSSIPDRKIAKVKQKKGTLIVYVDNGNSEVQSMDLVLTQYKITGGDISQIVNLVLDENGTRTEVFNADSTGSLDRWSKPTIYRHEKGEIHVSPFSFASEVQVDIEAITIINAFAIS